MRSYCCSVEWLTTYSNLVEYVQLLHSDGSSTVMVEMLLLLFKLLSIAFLALGFLVSFLSNLEGAPKIGLPLYMFSLAKAILTLLFLDSTLVVGETKIVVLVEAILEEEKLYPKPIQSEVDFWRLSVSSSFALEVLSN